MKTLAVIATTILVILNVVSMFVCFFVGIWTGDSRWGGTGLILLFALFATGGMAGIAWAAKGEEK